MLLKASGLLQYASRVLKDASEGVRWLQMVSGRNVRFKLPAESSGASVNPKSEV